jgi:hypothetical protein
MSNDWQVGDLAVCVDAQSRVNPTPTLLVEGRTYRVSGIYAPGRRLSSDFGSPGYIGLMLEGLRNDSLSGAFDARRFRKIRPDEHQACEEEFVTLLKRSKRKVVA